MHNAIPRVPNVDFSSRFNNQKLNAQILDNTSNKTNTDEFCTVNLQRSQNLSLEIYKMAAHCTLKQPFNNQESSYP